MGAGDTALRLRKSAYWRVKLAPTTASCWRPNNENGPEALRSRLFCLRSP